jgi:hypothetical protein
MCHSKGNRNTGVLLRNDHHLNEIYLAAHKHHPTTTMQFRYIPILFGALSFCFGRTTDNYVSLFCPHKHSFEGKHEFYCPEAWSLYLVKSVVLSSQEVR